MKLENNKNLEINGIKRVNNIPIYIIILIVTIFLISIIAIGVSKTKKKNKNSVENVGYYENIENIANEVIGEDKNGLIKPEKKVLSKTVVEDNNLLIHQPYVHSRQKNNIQNNSGSTIEDDELKKLKFDQLKKALEASTEVELHDENNSNSDLESFDNQKFFSSLKKEKYNLTDKNKKDKWTLNEEIQNPKTKFTLQTGSIIPAILTSSIISEIPGNIIAQVSENVYDSISGKFLLIPQGTRLFGAYSSNIETGQSRIFVAWQRLLFPNGKTLDIGSMPGVDSRGISGLKDKVDNHFMRVFGSAFLISAIVGGFAYADKSSESGNDKNLGSELSSSLGQQLGLTASKILEKNIDISPTIEIRQGYQFNIIASKDISFLKPYKF